MAKAVISTIGNDRPGLVSELTAAIHEAGLSVQDSRMSVLGGEFAVLMAVTGEEPALASLETTLAALCAGQDMALLFRRTGERSTRPARPYLVSVAAMDHPGIVAGVAAFFSAQGINIREMETQTHPAAHTGTPIFDLDMTIEVPAEVRINSLRDAFADYCDSCDLDGELTPER